MKLPEYIAHAFLFLCVVVFSGCSILQTELPATPREAIAYGYATVDSLADGLRIAKRDGHVTAEVRDEIADELDGAIQNLFEAEVALRLFEETGDKLAGGTVQERLAAAQVILRAVESALMEAQR